MVTERRSDEAEYDEINQIIAYEQGELQFDEVVELFQHLIDNGNAWTLQGMYGRMAKHLIEMGHCCPRMEDR